MASFSTVRSVQRAFVILEQLNLSKVTSVGDLHTNTGIPKPTIVRLLQTLETLGFVSRDPRHSGYRLTSKVMSLSAGFHSDPLVVEAGRVYAIGLTKKLTWPIAIAVLDQAEVVIRFSTIPDSPISPFHATVNMRLSLDQHALGLAYLAFCPADECKILVNLLRNNNPEIYASASEAEMLLNNRLETIRQQGFSERVLRTGNDNSNTIAVPILTDENRCLGTLGVTYFRSAVTRNEAVSQFLSPLQAAASKIARNIKAL